MTHAVLAAAIVALSDASTWAEAVREWTLVTVYEAEDPETCLCGHSPIVELCELQNVWNDRTATVGNCCAKKFMGLRSDLILSGLKRIAKTPGSAANAAVIAHAASRGWINGWEQQFLADTKRKRNLSQRQAGKRVTINAKILAGSQRGTT